METKPCIVIVEDHPVMRNGLAAWFTAANNWNVTGMASTLEEAKNFFRNPNFNVDIVLLDIQLADGWGLDLIPWLDAQTLSEKKPYFAVYSSFDNYAHVNAALCYGVRAYISKQRSEYEVENILQEVLNGKRVEPWIDETVSSKYQNIMEYIELLTKREAEILTLIKRGFSNQQIAESLHITRKTVENHLANIHDKTGLSRLDLMAM